MGEFLQHLTALSLGGGLVILVLMLAARLTGSRYAARWRCWVWLLLCLRLAVPLPLLPEFPAQRAPIQLPAVEDRVVLQPAQPPAVSASEPSPETQPTPDPAPDTPAPGAVPEETFSLPASQILFALWLAGREVSRETAASSWNTARARASMRARRRPSTSLAVSSLHREKARSSARPVSVSSFPGRRQGSSSTPPVRRGRAFRTAGTQRRVKVLPR